MWRNLLVQVINILIAFFFLGLENAGNIPETLLVLTVLELLQALYQVIVLLVLNFFGKDILNLDHDSQEHANKLKNTLIFNAFVFCQVSPAAVSGKVLH